MRQTGGGTSLPDPSKKATDESEILRNVKWMRGEKATTPAMPFKVVYPHQLTSIHSTKSFCYTSTFCGIFRFKLSREDTQEKEVFVNLCSTCHRIPSFKMLLIFINKNYIIIIFNIINYIIKYKIIINKLV